MSLNNRIYLREHELRAEHGSSTYIRSSNRIRATAVSPICFAEPELQRTIDDSFELRTITQTAGLGQGKDDYTSINTSPVSSISRSSGHYTNVSECLGSLSSPPGTVIHFQTTQSVQLTGFLPSTTDRMWYTKLTHCNGVFLVAALPKDLLHRPHWPIGPCVSHSERHDSLTVPDSIPCTQSGCPQVNLKG